MKAERHAKIIEIVKDYPITTQEELTEKLREGGFQVTQATVSRDIKELRLVKALDAVGTYRYTLSSKEPDAAPDRFRTIFADTVESVDYAGNIVVVRCMPGAAQGVCASMDASGRRDIVGTLAGDDTFICIVRDQEQAEAMTAEFKKLLKK